MLQELQDEEQFLLFLGSVVLDLVNVGRALLKDASSSLNLQYPCLRRISSLKNFAGQILQLRKKYAQQPRLPRFTNARYIEGHDASSEDDVVYWYLIQ